MTSRAVLIDIGGLLMRDHLLIGRTSEVDWWRVVGDRLQADESTIAAIRSDLAARTTWNTPLVAHRRSIEAKIAILSNAWPRDGRATVWPQWARPHRYRRDDRADRGLRQRLSRRRAFNA